MPVIELDFPNGLYRDIKKFSNHHGTDFESFVLWATSEKVGELKFYSVAKGLEDEQTSRQPLNRQVSRPTRNIST